MDHPKITVMTDEEPCMACPSGDGHNTDPLAPARGIVNGVALSLVFWALVILLLVHVT